MRNFQGIFFLYKHKHIARFSNEHYCTFNKKQHKCEDHIKSNDEKEHRAVRNINTNWDIQKYNLYKE